ncbi:MAG: hypothetical protein AAFY41_10375 [Bacteroidota bacterium]
MDKRQTNKLEMMETTNTYLDANTAAWSAIPIVSTYKNRLSQAIDGIKTAAQDQEAAQVFIGSSLQNLKITISEKMDILDDVLEAYADDTDNAPLLAQADNSKSDYLRLPNEDFETKVKNVIKLLEEHVAEMEEYGLTQDQIDDVKLSFGSYQDKRGLPRTYQVASRQATESIETLVADGMEALNKLDKVMKRFKRSNSSFYTGYEAARTIVDD